MTVEILPAPTLQVEVLERPGDPTSPKSLIDNQTITSTVPATAFHRFKVTVNSNYGTAVSRIHQLRIQAPSIFDPASLDKVDMLPNGTDMSVIGSDIIVSFPSGTLSTANTTLEFRLKENRLFNVPGTNMNTDDLSWKVHADYLDDSFTNATYSATNLPAPPFAGKFIADGNDDLIVYQPGTSYMTAADLAAIAGTGAAGKNWNITSIKNPSPNVTLYATNYIAENNQVFRINPGDPDYSYTQAVYVRNQGETNNDIRYIEITPPASFLTSLAAGNLTGVTVKKGATISPETSWTTLSQGSDYTVIDTVSGNQTYTLGNIIRVTLGESMRLLESESLSVTFTAAHNKTATGSYIWDLKAGNYDTSIPTVTGNDPAQLSKTKTMDVVSPTYVSNFIMSPAAISATSRQNTFTFTLTNESTAGDKLARVRLAFPGYFDVTSATLSAVNGTFNSGLTSANTTDYDTTGLTAPTIPAAETGTFNKDNYLIVDYCANIAACTGAEGLIPGASDTITVTLNDTFFNNTSITLTNRDDSDNKIARSDNTTVTVKASAIYDTSGGAYSYITTFPTGSNHLKITQPAPVATAYLNTAVLTTTTGVAPDPHSFTINIENNAVAASGNDMDNIIYRSKIFIPEKLGTTSVVSSLVVGGTPSNKGATVNITTVVGTGYYVDVNYEPVSGLNPGETDNLSFTLSETVPDNQGGSFNVSVWADNHSYIQSGGSEGQPDNTRWTCLKGVNDPAGCSESDTVRGTAINEGIVVGHTLALTFSPKDPQDEAYVKYFVDPDVFEVDTSSTAVSPINPADLDTLTKYGKDAQYAVYILGTKATIVYNIRNISTSFKIQKLQLDLSQMNVNGPGTVWGAGLSLGEIKTKKLGDVSSIISSATNNDLYLDDGTAGSGGSSETKRVVIDYSILSGGGLDVGDSDIIFITLNYDRSVLNANGLFTTDTNDYTDRYCADGTIFLTASPTEGNCTAASSAPTTNYTTGGNIHLRIGSDALHQNIGTFEPTITNSQTQNLYLRKAQFGRIVMQVAPKTAALTFTVLQSAAMQNINLFGVTPATQVPSIVSRAPAGSTYGRVVFDRLPVTTTGQEYVVKVNGSSPYVTEDMIIRHSEVGKNKYSFFTVSANSVTDFSTTSELSGPYQAKYAVLDRDALSDQTIVAPTDSDTWLKIPQGALDNSPRINIRIEPTATQVYGVINDIGSQMQEYSKFQVTQTSTHPVYNLVNELTTTGTLTPVVENQLKEPAEMQLGYSQSLITANGWDESNLGIFYWEYTRKQWIPLGGTVNTDANTVKVKLSYMNRSYTVMPLPAGSGTISNVVVFPRIFTPGRIDSYYTGDADSAGNSRVFGNVKLTFTLDRGKTGKDYEVAVYSLSGRKIKSWNRTNDYGQGSIYWDGRDVNGNLVSGGVYVYIIQLDGEKYRGTIVIVR